MAADPEAIVVGRLHADLYPQQVGVRLEDVVSFERFVGGFAGNVAVPASYINVSDSTITGFTSQGFQGDSIIGETRVASALIERNVLGHNTDSGGVDSKIAQAVVTDNTIYSDGDRALSEIRTGRYDVVVMDVKMPGRDGVSVFVDSGAPPPPVILMTAYALEERLREARDKQVHAVVQKPFAAAYMLGLVASAVAA